MRNRTRVKGYDMSRGKIAAVVVSVTVIALLAGFAVYAMNHNLLVHGTYYTRVDNAHVDENESAGGVINFEGSEPYVYKLPAFDVSGTQFEVQFGSSRVLRDGAYLKLEIEPLRGVVSWEEVEPGELPAPVAGKLMG